MRRRNRQGGTVRAAFTLIELLVAITIVALLVSLILPAVANARAAARRVRCTNSLRNLAIAMHGFESTQGRLPASGHFSATGPDWYHSWVLSLTPWIEQAAIAERWDYAEPVNGPTNAPLGQIGMDVLICPDDDSVMSGKGNLSYVVNGGFGWTVPIDCPAAFHVAGGPSGSPVEPIDLNGDGQVCRGSAVGVEPTDRQLLFRTGLFFLENWPVQKEGTIRHHALATVHDGTSQTIMLSENVRAGYDPQTKLGWSSPHPRVTSFFVSGYVCKDLSCRKGNVDYRRANLRGQSPFDAEAINSALAQAEGEAPWPSSYHGAGVHAAFADGHVRFISEQVDGAVFASLISPQGLLIAGPLAQAVFSGTDF